jgi:hypothetical protein
MFCSLRGTLPSPQRVTAWRAFTPDQTSNKKSRFSRQQRGTEAALLNGPIIRLSLHGSDVGAVRPNISNIHARDIAGNLSSVFSGVRRGVRRKWNVRSTHSGAQGVCNSAFDGQF